MKPASLPRLQSFAVGFGGWAIVALFVASYSLLLAETSDPEGYLSLDRLEADAIELDRLRSLERERGELHGVLLRRLVSDEITLDEAAGAYRSACLQDPPVIRYVCLLTHTDDEVEACRRALVRHLCIHLETDPALRRQVIGRLVSPDDWERDAPEYLPRSYWPLLDVDP